MYGDNRELHVLTHAFPTRRSSDLVDFRQDCFLNFEAGVSRSPPRTHTSPRPWSLPGSGFARPAIVTDFMSSAPESTSLCSAIPCYVPATPPHAPASWRWHSDLTTQERTQMSNSRFRRTIPPLAPPMAFALASTPALAPDGVSPALPASIPRHHPP